MKFKATKKIINDSFYTRLNVGYCNLQTLLSYESPIAYTVRREGWGADIYDVGSGAAIVTGYAPFGNIKPSYELCKKYEQRAEKIRYNYEIGWEQQKGKLKELICEFVREALEVAK